MSSYNPVLANITAGIPAYLRPDIPPLYKHQEHTAQFIVENSRCMVANDPGTGKTRSCLEAFSILRTTGGIPGNKFRMLVIAPLSILEPAWGGDIKRFTGFTYAVAHGSQKKRINALKSDADIVLINHDGVKDLVTDPTMRSTLASFGICVVDECTVFKHATTQRSKAMCAVARLIDRLVLMSGTINSNGVLNLWHLYFMLDFGQRLGKYFSKFRAQVCVAEPIFGVQNAVNWIEKPGILQDVSLMTKDITIRYKFEDCIDVPEHTVHTMSLPMPAFVRTHYDKLSKDRLLFNESGTISAFNAGVLVKKVLQLLSGAVYDQHGNPIKVHDERYKLALDLILERDLCVVVYNWQHELDSMMELCRKGDIPAAYINGSVPVHDRNQIVTDFQNGKYKVIFLHPQSAAHGLTLTAATSTIWLSPTYNAEHYEQINRRIYRAGQTKKTETIRIAYQDSEEEVVYEKLEGKLERMDELLSLFKNFTGIIHE